MGDGMKRATLEAMRTRSWSSDKPPWTMTGDEIVAFYEKIKAGDLEPYRALGCSSMSERKADRAVQILKRAGLVEFDKTARVWKAT